ncbi:Oidioi.mRNA.OKI2018_I69.PAR.g8568.t1.cds [Oikopleura dioica]|uniref:Oidioi.mRNA.OKI2018_I69.PAR.g8568.t1.cds n=1 Tax=Oikopleura dioica TaxID=34765 RepID=A0ABN7RLY8_OIKDI|nr:Oidioi.mRNA.OKI2018_I69.PAR.g8568.t1.cds [Oikopleura dioica]
MKRIFLFLSTFFAIAACAIIGVTIFFWMKAEQSGIEGTTDDGEIWMDDLFGIFDIFERTNGNKWTRVEIFIKNSTRIAYVSNKTMTKEDAREQCDLLSKRMKKKLTFPRNIFKILTPNITWKDIISHPYPEGPTPYLGDSGARSTAQGSGMKTSDQDDDQPPTFFLDASFDQNGVNGSAAILSFLEAERKKVFDDDRQYVLMKVGQHTLAYLLDSCLYLPDLSSTVKPQTVLADPIGKTYSYICANDSIFGDPEVAKIQWVERQEDIRCEILNVSKGYVEDYIIMNDVEFEWGFRPDLKGNFPENLKEIWFEQYGKYPRVEFLPGWTIKSYRESLETEEEPIKLCNSEKHGLAWKIHTEAAINEELEIGVHGELVSLNENGFM